MLRTSPGATKKKATKLLQPGLENEELFTATAQQILRERAAAPAAAAAQEEAAPAPAAAEDMDMESSTEQLRPVGQNTGGDTDGIASVIDACLAQPTEEAIGAAHLALYRYKRAHPGDTDAAMLEDALESAKRVCRRTDGTPAQPFRDIRPVAGEL